MCGFACAGQQKRHFRPGNGTSSGVDVRPADVRPADVRPVDVRAEDVRPEDTVLDSLAKDWIGLGLDCGFACAGQ